ncbi:hypothetical protein J1605_018796 [Eschrichtius robustus]|uniref:Uncharacterized protein n=1 Tax=Eschrichtius robustus TaxID=9764 RepID=A0AB34HUM2_ESCRO|nr:hypothetical protein J1605_018796 [Eschrichtius robustus]
MVVTVATVTCLLCRHGQVVENVSVVRGLIQSFKYIYCIHFEIKGRQKLEIAKQELFFIGCMGLIMSATLWLDVPNLTDTSCHELGNIQVPRTTLRTTFSRTSKIPQKDGATAGPGAQPAQ